MDAERIIEPTAEAEIQLCNYLDRRCWEVFAEIDESDRLNAFGTMIVVYDCVGDGIPGIYVGFYYNTPGYETRYPKYADEAKWNPSFWLRAPEEMLDSVTDEGAKLLRSLHDHYGGDSADPDDDCGVREFWGLVTGWAKRLKDSVRFKDVFPRSEFLLVGNGASDGANATRLVNGAVPSYVWSAGLAP